MSSNIKKIKKKAIPIATEHGYGLISYCGQVSYLCLKCNEFWSVTDKKEHVCRKECQSNMPEYEDKRKHHIVRGYKAFNKDFSCRGRKYTIGKTAYQQGPVALCLNGLHFCLNPLDIFKYYEPWSSRYAIVEARGKVDSSDEDSKAATDGLYIEQEISLHMLILEARRCAIDKARSIYNKCKKILRIKGFTYTSEKEAHTSTFARSDRSIITISGESSKLLSAGECAQNITCGDQNILVSTGDGSLDAASGPKNKIASMGICTQLLSTGDFARATIAGDRSIGKTDGNMSTIVSMGESNKLASSGYDSIVAALGADNIAKASMGCWLILTEWTEHSYYCNSPKIKNIKVFKVDGKDIKADTWYRLYNGKPVQVGVDYY